MPRAARGRASRKRKCAFTAGHSLSMMLNTTVSRRLPSGISWWLRVLGATSILYCWAVWAILGQASGSYVGPKTWAVLLIAAACSVMVAQPERETQPYPAPQPDPLFAHRVRPRLARPTPGDFA